MPSHLQLAVCSVLLGACVVGDGSEPDADGDVLTIEAPRPRNGFISVCYVDHRGKLGR